MNKYLRLALALMAVFMLAGCDTGSGSGGGDDVGVVEEATPPDGKVTLECATFEWWILNKGDSVKVGVVIAKKLVGAFTLTANNPERNFHYAYGKCQTHGRIVMYAKSVWGTGRLEANNITIVQGTSTYTHQGTLAQW